MSENEGKWSWSYSPNWSPKVMGGKMRNYEEFKEKCVKATNLWLEEGGRCLQKYLEACVVDGRK